MSEYVIVPVRGRRGEFREMIERCTRRGRRGHHHGRGTRGYQGRAGRGDIRAAILALLAEQPMHGYQIMRELRDRSGGAWRWPAVGGMKPHLAASIARSRLATPAAPSQWPRFDLTDPTGTTRSPA